MWFFDRERVVAMLRRDYPEGSKVICDGMEDPYRPVPEGTAGTVRYIDDMATIHVDWENGQSLGLVYGEDRFHKI